jgi:hypothetical protein
MESKGFHFTKKGSKMQETIRFSGVSYPDGTTIYGKRYGVVIDKDGFRIIRNRNLSVMKPTTAAAAIPAT